MYIVDILELISITVLLIYINICVNLSYMLTKLLHLRLVLYTNC